MAGIAISSTEFEDTVIGSNIPVLVDFWAEWCGPCKAIAPALDQLATEYEGKAKIVKIDVDKEGDLAMRYNVMSIPALLVFKGGKVVDQMVGAAPKQQIASMIDRAL